MHVEGKLVLYTGDKNSFSEYVYIVMTLCVPEATGISLAV